MRNANAKLVYRWIGVAGDRSASGLRLERQC